MATHHLRRHRQRPRRQQHRHAAGGARAPADRPAAERRRPSSRPSCRRSASCRAGLGRCATPRRARPVQHLEQTTGTSVEPAAVAVSAGAAAPRRQLRRGGARRWPPAQSLASRRYRRRRRRVGSGTLHIELGSWGAGKPASRRRSARPRSTSAIGPATDTLAEVRDKINAANAGVSASIVNDANGARLSLRSSEHRRRQRLPHRRDADDDGVTTDAGGLSAPGLRHHRRRSLTQTQAARTRGRRSTAWRSSRPATR